MGNGHKAAAFLHAQLGYLGNQSLRKVVFLGCQGEWSVPEERPKGLCLVPSSPLPFTPRRNPSPSKTAALRALSSIGGVTLRKEVGGGNPTTRRHGDQVTFQNSSSPEGGPFFGWTRLGLAFEGPTWIWRLWFTCRGDQALQVQGGLICWHVLTSSLSFRTVQPWDPSLLRFQGCDTSPSLQGVRGI